MKIPKLSLIVPVFNGEDHLDSCLSAIFNQVDWQENQDYEVIVVNDASTDKTAKTLKKYPVKVITHTHNLGRAQSRLTGARAARAKQLLFIDARVIIAPNYLSKLDKFLNKIPVVMGGTYLPKAETSHLARLFYLIRRWHYGRQIWPAPKNSYLITPANFRRSPKGMGVLSIPKQLFLQIAEGTVHNHKHQSDDTGLLSELVYQHQIPILRAKQLKWSYQPRQSPMSLAYWLLHRGQTFADYYLKPDSADWWPMVVGVLSLVGIVWLTWNYPVLLVWFTAILLSVLIGVAALLAEKPGDLVNIIWQLPLALSIFGTGVLIGSWRISRRFLPAAALTLLLAWLGYYIYKHQEILNLLRQVSPVSLAWLVALYGLFYYINGQFLRQILRLYDISIPSWEGLLVSAFSSLGNQVLPIRSGAGLRAWYLNHFHHLPLAKFMHSLAATTLITVNVTAFVSLVVVGWAAAFLNTAVWPLIGLFAAIWLGTGIAMFWQPPASLFKRLHFSSKFSRIISGWQSLQKYPKILIYLISYSVINVFIGAQLLWIEYEALGITTASGESVTWWQALILSTTVGLTPAGLGFRELLFMLIGQVATINPIHSLTAALLDRGASLLCLLILLPFSLIYFGKIRKLSHLAKH